MYCKCGNEISEARAALSFKTCLECGEKQAANEKLDKSRRTAIAYNKGPIMYMGSPDVAKSNLRGTMNAQGRSVAALMGGSLLDAKTVPAQFTPVKTLTGSLNVNDPPQSVKPKSPIGRLSNREPEMQELRPRRKVIGVAIMPNGDKQAIYTRHDPCVAKATRTVYF